MSAVEPPKPLAIVFIVISFILWIGIYVPIIVYHLRRYSRRRSSIVYQQRYSHITSLQSVLFIVKLIYQVFATISAMFLYGHRSQSDDIVRALDAYIAALFLYCFVWKFHLLSVR